MTAPPRGAIVEVSPIVVRSSDSATSPPSPSNWLDVPPLGAQPAARGRGGWVVNRTRENKRVFAAGAAIAVIAAALILVSRGGPAGPIGMVVVATATPAVSD